MNEEEYRDGTGLELIEESGQHDFDISSLVWIQKDKTPIRLGDMDDSHLRNTALMLLGMGYQTWNGPSLQTKIRWLSAIRMEWEKRHPRFN